MTQLSQDRLNQIATRKLGEMGVSAVVSQQGKVVGTLPLEHSGLSNPFSQAPLGSAHFEVEGHDWMRFLAPPLLASLRPLNFFEANDPNGLVAALRKALQARLDAVTRLKAHFQQLRLPAHIDPDAGMLVAPVPIEGVGTVVLSGDERGVWTSHLKPAHGETRPLPPELLDLSTLNDATDLGLYLGSLVQRLSATPARGAPPGGRGGFGALPSTGEFLSADEDEGPALAAPPAAETAEPMPTTQAFQVPYELIGGERGQPAQGEVPAGALTVGMLSHCLGGSAQLAHGVAVMRRFVLAGREVKLTLRQKRGRLLVGRITWGPDILWQGEVQVDKHPPMDEFIPQLLRAHGVDVGAAPAAAATPAAAAAPQATPSAPQSQAPTPAFGSSAGESLPVAGEVWVMNVVVEQRNDEEVRYSALNAEGQPYGAARILARSEFEKVFAENRGGYRLMVRVMGASPQQVVYVQLDASYQPNSDTRSIAPSVFLSNFLPEAAQY